MVHTEEHMAKAFQDGLRLRQDGFAAYGIARSYVDSLIDTSKQRLVKSPPTPTNAKPQPLVVHSEFFPMSLPLDFAILPW